MSTVKGLTPIHTIRFMEHDQDNLNFFDFTKKDRRKLSDIYDYRKIVKDSIEDGRIKHEDDIRCFVDGSDHVQPYFTSNTADEEYATYDIEEEIDED